MNAAKNNVIILKSIFVNRVFILIITGLFFITSIAITLVTDKKYTATGLVYPTKSNIMKEVVNNPSFGYEMQADRLIQLFQSQQMENRLIEKFDLITQFDIDSSGLDWTNQLHKKYLKSVTFKRTKYLSVEIKTIIDNPVLASNMVNYMINFIDTIRRDVFLINTIIWEADLASKTGIQEEVVNKLLTTIFNSDNANIPNVLAENKVAHITSRKENANTLQGDQIILGKLNTNHSVDLEKLINKYYLELGILNRMQADLIRVQEKISSPFPKIYVINHAIVDEKKTSPSFLKNGIIGLVVGLILSISFVLGKVKWNDLLELLKD